MAERAIRSMTRLTTNGGRPDHADVLEVPVGRVLGDQLEQCHRDPAEDHPARAHQAAQDQQLTVVAYVAHAGFGVTPGRACEDESQEDPEQDRQVNEGHHHTAGIRTRAPTQRPIPIAYHSRRRSAPRVGSLYSRRAFQTRSVMEGVLSCSGRLIEGSRETTRDPADRGLLAPWDRPVTQGFVAQSAACVRSPCSGAPYDRVLCSTKSSHSDDQVMKPSPLIRHPGLRGELTDRA